MSTLRWFRKNNKKILAIATAALAFAFLLPTFAGRNQGRDLTGRVFGSLNDGKGGRIDITTGSLNLANRKMKSLEAVGLSFLLRPNLMDFQVTATRFPELALHQVLFADNRDSQMNRNFLFEYAQQGGLAMDREQMETVFQEINQLTGSEPAETALYFILLSEEARQRGIQTSEQEIDAVLRQCLMLGQQGYPVMTPQNAMKMNGLTESQFRSAVGDCLAILAYARAQTASQNISEPQLKKLLLDQECRNQVSGNFVIFPAFVFREQAGEPTEEQIQEQFNKFRTVLPGQTSDANPFGFGYRLENRVQTEYIRVDLKPLEQKLQMEFSALPASQRDQQLQKFWTDNPSLFTEEVTTKDEKGQDKTETRTVPFDEAAEKARQLLLEQNALTEATQIITKAKNLCGLVPEAGSAPADFSQIAAELTADTVPVEYHKTDFLSYTTAQGKPALSQSYLVQKQTRLRSLLAMLFSCEPLSKGPQSRLDPVPVKMMETIAPLVEYDYRDRPAAVLLARVTAVDPQRDPVSMDDDGTKGPASAASPENAQKSLLRNRVKQDWISGKSYEIAIQNARQFAQAAQADWKASLEKLNESLRKDQKKDQPEPPKPQETPKEQTPAPAADTAQSPTQPEASKTEPQPASEPAAKEEEKKEEKPAPTGPLREDSLQNLRQMNEQLQEMARQNMGDYFRNQMVRNWNLIRQAADYACKNNLTAPSAAPVVLEEPEQLRCVVYKDLQVKFPDEGQYLRKKPLLAQSLQILNQQRAALVYFNPNNIKLRSGYQEKRESDEPSGATTNP